MVVVKTTSFLAINLVVCLCPLLYHFLGYIEMDQVGMKHFKEENSMFVSSIHFHQYQRPVHALRSQVC